jgi:hypothetical protein
VRVGNAGSESTGAQRTDTWYRFEPFAHAVAPVPSKNASVSFQDLTLDQIELCRQRHETVASLGRDMLIFALGNQRQQLVDTIAPDTRNRTCPRLN